MDNAAVHVQDGTVKRINAALSELTDMLGQNCPEYDYPCIMFLLGDTKYAVNAKYVMRAAVLYEVVPFADAKVYYPGVIWDRDGIIRLLDLRALFGRGNYLTAIEKGNKGLPMIIVIGLDGIRRGIIVDRIITMEYLGSPDEYLACLDSGQASYIQGTARYGRFKMPVPVINPKSFSSLEFEDPHSKIDWKERIDMILKAEYLLRN